MNIESTNKNLSLLFMMLMGPISIILLIISVYLIQPKVEASLVLNVTSALKKNNIEAEVLFSGRDGILKGEVENQDIAEKAQRISGAVFGTRIIHSHLSIRRKKDKMGAIDNSIQHPIIRKISYGNTILPKETINNSLSKAKEELLRHQKTPILISEVDRIIANMDEKVLPVINSSHIVKPIELNKVLIKSENNIIHQGVIKKKVWIASDNTKRVKPEGNSRIIVKKPNELLTIINDFNLSIDDKSSETTSHQRQKEKLNHSASAPQKLEEIDLSILYFSNNSTILSKDMQQVLNKISTSIKAYSYSYIEIITYGNNSDLAYAQGVAIREYLATREIRRNIIHVAGHTVTPNTTKKAKVNIFAR